MKKFSMSLLIWLFLGGICAAQSVELTLDAGSKSLYAGGLYRKELGSGYMKAGIYGQYTDDDDTEYKWGELKIVAGNDTMVRGLACDIGLKGIIGSADTNEGSGDVGALAFLIRAGYTIPKNVMPIPLEIFSELNHAPAPLSFSDTENFTQLSLGLGVHIISNASVTLTYTDYDVDMENGPGNWTLDENVIRAGVTLRF